MPRWAATVVQFAVNQAGARDLAEQVGLAETAIAEIVSTASPE